MLAVSMLPLLLILLILLIVTIADKTFVDTEPNSNSDFLLSDTQNKLLNTILRSKNHIYITGKAGSGKSTVLREYKKAMAGRAVVIAPTGIAAINVSGQTIHSMFQLGVGVRPDKAKLTKKRRKILASVEVVIIDEVSMVRADIIDAIDRRLRQAKHRNRPFGGARLVMFGDLYQLPPIVSDSKMRSYLYEQYESLYFFSAHVWKHTQLNTFELNEVFRQSDEQFIAILNEIRIGKVSRKSLDTLNSRVQTMKTFRGSAIVLSSTSHLVNEINRMRLSELKTKEYTYYPKKTLAATNSKPFDPITLRVGAQVIFTKNDPGGLWVNGSIGIITKLNKRRIWVRVGYLTIQVPRAKWSETEFTYTKRGKHKEKQVNTYKQFPLKLAWAVTIHKSQGQTYEQCIIDLKRGAFAHGQAYVALSRCRSLEGITLIAPIMAADISVDPKIKHFMINAKQF